MSLSLLSKTKCNCKEDAYLFTLFQAATVFTLNSLNNGNTRGYEINYSFQGVRDSRSLVFNVMVCAVVCLLGDCLLMCCQFFCRPLSCNVQLVSFASIVRNAQIYRICVTKLTTNIYFEHCYFMLPNVSVKNCCQ